MSNPTTWANGLQPTRRGFLLSTAAGGFALAGGLAIPGELARAAADPELTLVREGAATAVVIIGDDADDPTRAAAQLLITYVQKATGAQLPLLTESALRQSGRLDVESHLYVGSHRLFTAYARGALDDLDPEGYVFSPVTRGLNPTTVGLSIVGGSSRGTEYGVTEFLERYVGVRWLLPGPDGEDVPQQQTLSVPLIAVRDEPACLVRTLSPLHGNSTTQAQQEWYLRNRGHVNPYGPGTRMRFLHNMHAVLPAAKYYADHPDWYPNRRRPTTPSGWQPSVTAEGTVEAAVEVINSYFDANPEETVYSLGINDGGGLGGGWVESKPDHPSYPGVFNHSGFLHMSDLYFAWVNRVVEGVLVKHPDKWFGCLAYHTTWQAPSFTVHPRVVPFLCDDRATWADEEAGAHGRMVTEEWAAVATTLGWYEYGWSFDYSGPRVAFRQHAENAAFLYSKGVKYNHTEFYPTWADGPKAWLFAKHLWRRDIDIETALSEWYERAVGPAAATDLAAFYDLWETFWTDRALDSIWFRNWFDRPYQGYRTNYVPIDDYSYLQVVTDEDVATSRRLLESTVQKAETAAQKARAGLLLRRFEYHEAAIQSYPRQGPDAPVSEADALALVDRAAALFEAAVRRDALAEEFSDDPVLSTPALVTRGQKSVAVDSPGFAYLVEWVRSHADGAARARIDQLAADLVAPATMRAFARMVLAVVDGATPVNENSSFETGSGNQATGWDFWIGGPGAGSMRRTTDMVMSGSHSVVVDGVDRGGPNRLADLPGPGNYGFVGFYYTPAGSQTAGTLQPTLDLRSASGAKRSTLSSPEVAAGGTAGRWSTVCALFRVDDPVATEVKIIVITDGFKQGEQIYCDDFGLYRLGD